MHKKLIFVAAVLALLATTVALNPVQAARGGNGGGGNHDNGTLAVYQGGVEVSSVAPGSAIEVRGSGFGANKTLYVGLEAHFGMTPVTTDGSGSFKLATVAPSTPDTYAYIAMKFSHRTWVIAGRVEFSVQ